MRAAVGRTLHDIEIVDVDPSPLASDEVRIRIAFAGICGSDLHALRDGDPAADPLATFGHEYSGTVIEIGSAVADVAPGQRVTCLPRIACLRCPACHSGRPYTCEGFWQPPRFGLPPRGAWADEIVVPARVVFALPADLPLRSAALCEPLACALRAVDRAYAQPGHLAVVIGGGPIGQLTAVLALRAGARRVILSDPQPTRRDLARQLGSIPVDPEAEPLAAVVANETLGRGADVVYEAVGSGETVREATELAGQDGTIVVVGVAPSSSSAQIRPLRILQHELTIVGACAPERTFSRALVWLPTIALDALVTHTLPLEEAPRAVAIAAGAECGKVLLAPAGAEAFSSTP
jgi:L-iditol 2-dehydrogenase